MGKPADSSWLSKYSHTYCKQVTVTLVTGEVKEYTDAAGELFIYSADKGLAVCTPDLYQPFPLGRIALLQITPRDKP